MHIQQMRFTGLEAARQALALQRGPCYTIDHIPLSLSLYIYIYIYVYICIHMYSTMYSVYALFMYSIYKPCVHIM